MKEFCNLSSGSCALVNAKIIENRFLSSSKCFEYNNLKSDLFDLFQDVVLFKDSFYFQVDFSNETKVSWFENIIRKNRDIYSILNRLNEYLRDYLVTIVLRTLYEFLISYVNIQPPMVYTNFSVFNRIEPYLYQLVKNNNLFFTKNSDVVKQYVKEVDILSFNCNDFLVFQIDYLKSKYSRPFELHNLEYLMEANIEFLVNKEYALKNNLVQTKPNPYFNLSLDYNSVIALNGNTVVYEYNYLFSSYIQNSFEKNVISNMELSMFTNKVFNLSKVYAFGNMKNILFQNNTIISSSRQLLINILVQEKTISVRDLHQLINSYYTQPIEKDVFLNILYNYIIDGWINIL